MACGLYVLMETGVHGTVKWSNDRIIDRRLQSLSHVVAPSSEPLELGWSPYTSVQCIGTNGEYVEQLGDVLEYDMGRTQCLSVGNSPLGAKRSALIPHLHAWVEAKEKRPQREH